MMLQETRNRLEELAQMGGGNCPYLKEEALSIIGKLQLKETNSYRREKLGSLEGLFQRLFSTKGCKQYGVEQLRTSIYADLLRYNSWTDEMARKAQGFE